MGDRPYAKLFFGIALPYQCHPVPWSEDAYDYDWGDGSYIYGNTPPEKYTGINAWLRDQGLGSLKDMGLDIGTSGYHDEPSYFLAVKASLTSMDWDDEYVSVDPGQMAPVPDEWLAAINRFKKAAGLDGPPVPCSYCNGTLRMPHRDCGGAGIAQQAEPEIRCTHKECIDGKVPCHHCRGTGLKPSHSRLTPGWFLTTFY